MALSAGESQKTSQRYGKHVMSPEAAPDPSESVDPCGIRRAREVSGIERPDGRADNKVSVEPVPYQLTQHTCLNRSQAAPTGKDQSRFLGGLGHELPLRCVAIPTGVPLDEPRQMAMCPPHRRDRAPRDWASIAICRCSFRINSKP